MSITLYTKPNCVQCTATKRALDKRGLEYTSVDVSVDGEALDLITKDWGFQQAPVVAIEGLVLDNQQRGDNGVYVSRWSGFRPDLIEQLS